LEAGQYLLTELLARFRSAERLEDCLQALPDTRALADCAIVGFKEGYQGPAVARIPRPQYWARQFGWPANFMRKWLSINVSRASLMPEDARSCPDAVLAWSVPDPDDPAQGDRLSEDQALGARFLLAHGIHAGLTATVRRPAGTCAQVSWLKPRHDSPASRSGSDRDLLMLTQAFFDALDRVRPDTLRDNLTPRELECLSWAAYGCSDKEIAQEIGCVHDTVRFHVKNVVRKLGASNRTHAVAMAIQTGVIRLGGTPRAIHLRT
jgi:DNA-binding CsgD family transcriptional regulator